MPEAPVSYLLALAIAFGIVSFLTIQRFVIEGVRLYQRRVLLQLGHDLKLAFVAVSARRLLLVGAVGVLVAGLVGYLTLGTPGLVAFSIAWAVVPGVLPRVIAHRRSEQFVQQLPECLSSMASGLRAGSSLARALELVAGQQPPPTSQEFSVVLSEYRMGKELTESLEDMAGRIKRQEVALMNAAINIARTVGGNLADTLDDLAKTLREKAQVEGKIRALTAMGKMQGWVIAALPLLLATALYRQEPEGMRALLHEPIGWATLAVLSVMMALAGFMIRRIVSIDV